MDNEITPEEISDASMEILTRLSFMRVGLVLVRDVMVGEEQRLGQEQILSASREFLNELSHQIDGEDFTMDEVKEFADHILNDLTNPYEGGYFLQQVLLHKTNYKPEKFRDPDPIRTIKDVRGMNNEARELYVQSMRIGKRPESIQEAEGKQYDL